MSNIKVNDLVWHQTINAFQTEQRYDPNNRFMYLAKDLYIEVPRMSRVFHRDQLLNGDMKLKCCLGVVCVDCPQLKALEQSGLTHGEIAHIKAWTCATHIVSNGGDLMGEGFITAADDRQFWEGVYTSLSDMDEEDQ